MARYYIKCVRCKTDRNLQFTVFSPTKKNKQGRKNYQENTGTKLITNTKKQKLKIQSRVWNFKNTMLKKRKKKTKEKTNKQKQAMSQKL